MIWIEVAADHFVNMAQVTDVIEGDDGIATLCFAFYDQDAAGPAAVIVTVPYSARVLAWVRRQAAEVATRI